MARCWDSSCWLRCSTALDGAARGMVSMEGWMLLGVAVVVMLYLIYVIVHPEKF